MEHVDRSDYQATVKFAAARPESLLSSGQAAVA